MRPTDKLIAPPRSTLDQARTYAARFRFPNGDKDILDYLAEVYRLAPLLNLDPSIVIAQSALETANWTSAPWQDWLNPAGIGITYTGQDPGYRWKDGTDAARAQICHLAGYVYGKDYPKILEPYIHLDPRFHLVVGD